MQKLTTKGWLYGHIVEGEVAAIKGQLREVFDWRQFITEY